ncbi:hypothetical protein A6A40_08395 [Azospirillum humicireducens]|uniref:ACT domain-containing protein n=1 Tax=Azospirillum humicireducens TaxID=1226968 RepID=A0A168Y6S2_9PROT|nr:hypothetical protein [Azospirillum humicireducens]ANC91927.1 hypothetical protein A6A40_08395 [Azospirillum humicireducens]
MSHTVKPPPASAPDARDTAPGRRVAFTLVADADPGTLPRILEFVAKRGLVPLALHSRLTDDTLAIAMEVGDLPQAETDHIGRCLGQIPMVARVTVAELAATASAAELVAAE